MDNTATPIFMALSDQNHLRGHTSELFCQHPNQSTVQSPTLNGYSFSHPDESQQNTSIPSMLAMASPQGLLYNTMSISARQESRLKSSKRQTSNTGPAPVPSSSLKRQKTRNVMRQDRRKPPLPLQMSRGNKLGLHEYQYAWDNIPAGITSETGSPVSECCSSCSEGLPCAELDCEKQKDAVVPCTKQSCDKPVCSEPCLPECTGRLLPVWRQGTIQSSDINSTLNNLLWDQQGPRVPTHISLDDKVDAAILNAAKNVPTNSGAFNSYTPSSLPHTNTSYSPEQELETLHSAREFSSHHIQNASTPIVSGTGAIFDAEGWVTPAFHDSNFNNGTFNCAWAECQLPFSTQEEWSSHLHQAHVDPQMTFDCPLQSDSCPSNINSHPLDHLQAAHGFDFTYNNYSCPAPTCVEDEIFCNPAMLHNHFDQAHATPATGSLFCQWNACNSTFTDQRELLYHLTEDHQLVTPAKEPTVECTASHAEKANYPTAIPDEELSEDGSNCACQWNVGSGLCGVICENPKELQDHITEQHLKSLNKKTGYYCQWDNCNRRKFGEKAGFSQRGKLVRHMQTHTICKPIHLYSMKTF